MPRFVIAREKQVVTSDDRVNWWSGARLCRSGQAPDGEPEQLGFGTLAEMVDLAFSRPRSERERLSIRMELTGEELSWTDIAVLLGRPDRPTMI